MLLQNVFKHEEKTVGAKVIRNVIFTGARLLLLAPLPFIVIPFFLGKLGPSGYGTWAAFLAISGVTSLADLGLVTTLSKHVAEFYALKDFRALSRLINTGFVLYLAVACLISSVLWVSSPLVLSALFRSSSVSVQELHVLWRYLMLLIVANILALLFSSVVTGLQRMDLSTGITSLNLLLSAGLSILLLSCNMGLRGILYSYVSAAWIMLCVYVYALRQLLPEVTLNPLECSWTEAKEILSFSVKTYVTQVAVLIHSQIEKIYLARFVGVVSVGWYDISSDLAGKLRAIPGLVLTPVMPAAAELHAQSDQGRLASLHYRAHKYLAFVGVPFVAYVVFVSKRFVELWVGPSLSVIAIPLSVLMIVNFINLISGPGLLILVAKGNLRPGLCSAVLGIVLNLSLSFLFIQIYGFRGAVIGTSLSLGLASLYFLYLFHREMGYSFSEVVRHAYLKPVICSLASIALLSMLTRSRPSSWSTLLLQGVAFGLVYLALLLHSRFFDTFDLAIAEDWFPIPRIARRIIPGA